MKRFILLLCSICVSISTYCQDSLLDLIESVEENLTYATFKTTKIINLQSVEQPAEKELDFIVSHRFGTINSGIENLYGLDYGNIRMSFNYGLKDYITLGLARSSSQKVIDFSVKTKLINQGKNNLQAPWLGITGFISISILLSLLVFIGEAIRDAFDPRKIN